MPLCFRILLCLALGMTVAKAGSDQPAKGTVYGLQDCVNLALKQNLDLVVARKRIEEAKGGIIEARAGVIPYVESTAVVRQREQDNQSTSNLDSQDERYRATVQAVHSLYSGGSVRSKIAIAKITTEKSRQEFQAVVNRVVMDVRNAYYDVLYCRANVEVRRQSVEVLREEHKVEKARFDAGTVGELNVRRAEVAVANEEPALLEAENDLSNAYIRLSTLLAIPYRLDSDRAPFEVVGELVHREPPFDLTYCLTRAENVRPEIKAAETEIDIETKQAIVDRSALLPKIDLFAGYEVFENTNLVSTEEIGHGYVFGVAGHWKIFDGFATSGKLKATRARKESAMAYVEATRLEVQAEVRAAFLQYERARKTLASQSRNVVLAEKAFGLAQANSKAGVGTQLDILQTAYEVTKARSIRLKALRDQNVAVTKLYRAIAGDLNSDLSELEADQGGPFSSTLKAEPVAIALDFKHPHSPSTSVQTNGKPALRAEPGKITRRD